MNEKSPPKTPAISTWLHEATIELAGAGIGSAKLDAEIILAHTIKQSRTFLHSHGDDPLTDRQLEIADARLQLRLDRTPVAYIIGHKEFYGRLFRTTPATLIPRPETEEMITFLKDVVPKNRSLLPSKMRLIDIGTGSGCIGITAKLELPELDVTLSDVSRHALNVATINAKKLHADVTIQQSNLLDDYPFSPDYILANLPYVDPSWSRSPETNYEPEQALFAGENGLHLIRLLITQTAMRASKGAYLLLEADPRQHDAIIAFAKEHGLLFSAIRGFIVALTKS